MRPSTTAILLLARHPGLREALSRYRLVETPHDIALPACRVAVLSSLTPFGAEDMDRCPDLGLIVTIGAGSERIDHAAARARRIRIETGAGANAEDVADLALGLLLAVIRRLPSGDARVREGTWRSGELQPIRSFGRRRIGIMGMGAIGSAVSRRLPPFGCEIGWTGPRSKPEIPFRYFPSLMELARWSDALIVAAPLNEVTAGAIGRPAIDALGPGGVVVNVGRGGIVDEPALIAALREGRLAGAGLDVFAIEPTPPESWRGVPNVLLSPHAGAATFEAQERLVACAVRHVIDFLGPLMRIDSRPDPS
ncbi:MAG: NAD(P)-dependent oxidoreductase [Sphingomonas sp.]